MRFLHHHARDVVLCDVRDLMRQHAGEFRLALRRKNQAGMYADVTARQSKRI